jgi:hypothetical protein
VSPYFNTGTADIALLSRKTALRFPLTGAVSRKTLAVFPLIGAVSRKTSADFPLTELLSADTAPVFTDIESMSVGEIWITSVITQFADSSRVTRGFWRVFPTHPAKESVGKSNLCANSALLCVSVVK